MQIIPTTNPQVDFDGVEARLLQFRDLSSWIQIDVTDGILVSPATFPLELLNRVNPLLENNLFDIHLMVKSPESWLNKCFFVQASRVIGQVEMMGDRDLFISTIKDHGLEAGLAFDVNTSLDDNIPSETDLILLMGRPMGFTPQPFNDRVFSKIQDLKTKNIKIAIDGGVTPDNLSRFQDLGVDIIYSGQYYLNLLDEINH